MVEEQRYSPIKGNPLCIDIGGINCDHPELKTFKQQHRPQPAGPRHLQEQDLRNH